MIGRHHFYLYWVKITNFSTFFSHDQLPVLESTISTRFPSILPTFYVVLLQNKTTPFGNQ